MVVANHQPKFILNSNGFICLWCLGMALGYKKPMGGCGVVVNNILLFGIGLIKMRAGFSPLPALSAQNNSSVLFCNVNLKCYVTEV